MKTALYLDDIRTPIVTQDGHKDWHVVRDFKGFVDHISANGIPDLISFDHDLADEHYTPQEYWNDYEKSKAFQASRNYQEKTGLDCAKWLCDFAMNNNTSIKKCVVHSANPVGADNIIYYINNFKKAMGHEPDCSIGVFEFTAETHIQGL